jgi:hypothetical protein
MSASENGLKELEKWCEIRRQEYYERVNKNISEKCDVELERIKRYRPLPVTSRYRKNHAIDYYPANCGFAQRMTFDSSYVGDLTDWEEAFERFEKKKVNIYGKKVDRSKVFTDKEEIKNFKYGKQSQ